MQDEPRPIIAIFLPSNQAAVTAARVAEGPGAQSAGQGQQSEVATYTWHDNYGYN